MSQEGGGHHVSLDLGDRHACTVRSDGKVYCWGDNGHRQSNPASSNTSEPSLLYATAVSLSLDAAEVATGGEFSCARLRDGTVSCWGANADGVIPVSGTADVTTPTSVLATLVSETAGARTARALSAGKHHLCMLRDDGSVFCRGDNASGQRSWTSAEDVVRSGGNAMLGIVKIAAGAGHTCALNDQGEVYCWGRWNGSSTGPTTRARSSDRHPT